MPFISKTQRLMHGIKNGLLNAVGTRWFHPLYTSCLIFKIIIYVTKTRFPLRQKETGITVSESLVPCSPNTSQQSARLSSMSRHCCLVTVSDISHDTHKYNYCHSQSKRSRGLSELSKFSSSEVLGWNMTFSVWIRFWRAKHCWILHICYCSSR